jgi:predicted RNA-binding Zn-ribbon protein involved in translation (DUF1610 family)
MHITPGDVAMLGLAGFVALGAAEVNSELEVSVETTAVRIGCPACGVITRSHGRREVMVRDVDAFGQQPGCGGVNAPGAATSRTVQRTPGPGSIR